MRQLESSPGQEPIREVRWLGGDLVGPDDRARKAADISGKIVQIAGRVAVDERKKQFAFVAGTESRGYIKLAIMPRSGTGKKRHARLGTGTGVDRVENDQAVRLTLQVTGTHP